MSVPNKPPDRYHRGPRIKDLYERVKDVVLRYRKLRDREYPVYAPPPPVAYLRKMPGENRWTAWLRVTPQMVTDSLILLSGPKPVYVSIHEIRERRQRRIQSLNIQTTDPAEE